MSRMTFWAVTALASIYVLVALAEAYMYSTLDKTLEAQREIQVKLSHVEQTNAFTQQLVRRMVVDSANDPNLIQILKMNGVKVSYQSTDKAVSTVPTPETAGTPIPPTQN